MTRICYVPQDAAALSVGADHVARAIAAEAERRGIDMTIIRTGSRGLLYLEPLVEIATERGRVDYGPVAPGDVAGLFDSGFPDGADHRLGHGLTEEIPYLKQQERLTFARCGIVDPVSVDDYVAHGGFAGLKRALAISPAEIVKEVTDSGLRGRGGAGFPTGIKWKTVLQAAADQKYICCNADEGDSGTFADRMLMEGDPFALIEGMTIAAIATGATVGYIYIRSEYPHAIAAMRPQSRRPRRRAGSVATLADQGRPSLSTSAKAAAPTSAARRRRCWRASRASAASCASSRRFRRSKACSASRP
jgi:formate dehydrogenase iron-sulfur subunit